ncbi:hypothetical protein EJO69_08765 [Flaviflexus salsibiostraticola]|uniref:Uncharacterized protein n=1 Tax=Flaviflexus salsibiostraticola TaxID=1282737 RepID=A0A3Q8WU50_9ACTO|nr:hypothetical protein [Flaviflexus salsibiostraticola]AZN30386.1 hypothetical protein EJO69_08765 [Flaviflexus salsibiostraticola]
MKEVYDYRATRFELFLQRLAALFTGEEVVIRERVEVEHLGPTWPDQICGKAPEPSDAEPAAATDEEGFSFSRGKTPGSSLNRDWEEFLGGKELK